MRGQTSGALMTSRPQGGRRARSAGPGRLRRPPRGGSSGRPRSTGRAGVGRARAPCHMRAAGAGRDGEPSSESSPAFSWGRLCPLTGPTLAKLLYKYSPSRAANKTELERARSQSGRAVANLARALVSTWSSSSPSSSSWSPLVFCPPPP